MEQWKPIIGHESEYEVSNEGRIRSVAREVPCLHGQQRWVKPHVLKPYSTKHGYLMCSLGRGLKVLVHREVAKAFLGDYSETLEVNHKNLIKTDNRAKNLEWVTHGANMQHAHDNGAFPPEPHRKKLLCKETGEIFGSSYRAAEWVNAKKFQYSGSVKGISSNIRASIRRKRKAYGFHWQQIGEQPSTTIPKGSTPERVEMGDSA